MQFLYQPLTWGFLLVAVPILVHLINMLRHRKVRWAAMDFLLESHRRNRRWVMLKQWLLLASRILAMILLVAMLAQWVSNSQWLGLLGGRITHHYVLLDDSYSMAELEQGETAYGRGLSALGGIVRSISARGGQHQLTLLRFSRASLATRNSGSEARIDSAADLIAQSVPRDATRLLDRINATAPTALQLSPDEALDLISPLITEGTEEKAEVYLLSDLRRNEFGEPEATKNRLQTLADSSAQIQIIDCGGAAASNLSVAAVEPEQEVWAAGVPLMVRFQIRNQSAQPVRNAVVQVKSITYADGITTPKPEATYSGQVMDLPPVVIESIGAGETVTRQVQVVFGVPGQHVVEVAVANDALLVDNRRWCVIAIQQSQRVLLIDGELDGSNAYFFKAAVNPDGRLKTGMEIEQADASFLRDADPSALERFDVIGLLDVPRLDPQAIDKLQEYCRQGRGVFFTTGRNTNLSFVNESLFRGGEGLFPVELSGIVEVQQEIENSQPQVVVSKHPVLLPLTQLSSSPFFLVRIRTLLAASKDSVAKPLLEIVATGPGGVPLLVDQPFGKGRVLTLLTGFTPEWSNWAQDPTFVVLALRSLGYLGSFRRDATSRPIGSSIEMLAADDSVLPEAELLMPAREGGLRLRLQRTLDQPSDDAVAATQPRFKLDVALDEMDRDVLDGMLRPGIFETWMVDVQGVSQVQNQAHNVAAAEGNLERVGRSELERKFSGLPIEFRSADALSNGGSALREQSHSTLIMALLAALLLGEQFLAYSASYHAPRVVGGMK